MLDARYTQNLNVCKKLTQAFKLWLCSYKNLHKTMRYGRLLLKTRIYNLEENRAVFDKNFCSSSGGYEFDCYLEPGYYKFRAVFPSLIIKNISSTTLTSYTTPSFHIMPKS